MFIPPHCPNLSCAAHDPAFVPPRGRRFFTCRGYYRPKCRNHPIPRFQCRICKLGFSRQTFRYDYCDHKPHLNARLLELIRNGHGLRQSGRELKLSRRCTQLKARKISRHLERLPSDTAKAHLSPWIPPTPTES